MIKKTDKGYKVDIRPNGHGGIRARKTFATLAEARAFERHILTTHKDAKPWQEQKKDNRTLSDLVKLWYELHGQNLKSGHRRIKELNKVIALLNNPIAHTFDAAAFTEVRRTRLQSVNANTVNHDLTNLKSLFNELIRLGHWNHANPLSHVRKIKIDENELNYLTLDEIRTLLAALDQSINSHARISARVCLATGARWGEACNIKARQVANGRITFNATKNGKNRTIPISDNLAQLIVDHAPLVDGMNTFKRTVDRIGLDLPKGQMTHVLRHSFASHFMINGGNIVTLQRILGHGSIMMTMRYAHLSPEHLNEATKLNPLS